MGSVRPAESVGGCGVGVVAGLAESASVLGIVGVESSVDELCAFEWMMVSDGCSCVEAVDADGINCKHLLSEALVCCAAVWIACWSALLVCLCFALVASSDSFAVCLWDEVGTAWRGA